MKRTYLALTILVILIVAVLSFTVTFAFTEEGKQWHNASSVSIKIGAYDVNLQEAIDNGYLFDVRMPTKNGDLSSVMHSADEVSVVINGYTMTIQDALKNNVFSNGATGNYGFNPNKTFHDSYEIKTTSPSGEELSFQDLINDGKLTCIPFTVGELGYTCGGSTSDGCGGTLDFGTCPGQTCVDNHCKGECESGAKETIDCSHWENSYPCRNYIDSTTRECSGAGSWSDYTCTYTDRAKGTVISGWGACDGVGNVVGSFSGTGCSQCIWGSSGSYCKTKTISSTKKFSGPQCDSKDGGISWTTTMQTTSSGGGSGGSGGGSTGGGSECHPGCTSCSTGSCPSGACGTYWTGCTKHSCGTCSCSGGGCFDEEELVLTNNGYLKISKISVGDVVVSYNENGFFTESIVGDVLIHDGKDEVLNDYDKYPLLDLAVEINGEVVHTKVTSIHFYLDPESGTYKHIGNFKAGDSVRTIYGIGKILSIKKLNSEPVVYNLHMRDGPNNYIVNGIVVHNMKTQ